MRTINLFIKRTFDILLSGLGIVILSPLFCIAIIGIKISMPGPVFFKQVRAGRNGKPFSILKFRSMKVDTVAERGHDVSKDRDRVTGFGKFLRRSKIDELPQLINVFIGDMSLVGPRPTFMEQVQEYDDFKRQRLLMRPGMTGLAQINGNASISWDERIKYDVKYVHEFNVLLDIRILFGTVKVVLFGEEKYAKKFEEK